MGFFKNIHSNYSYLLDNIYVKYRNDIESNIEDISLSNTLGSYIISNKETGDVKLFIKRSNWKRAHTFKFNIYDLIYRCEESGIDINNITHIIFNNDLVYNVQGYIGRAIFVYIYVNDKIAKVLLYGKKI